MPQILSDHNLVRSCAQWFRDNFIPDSYRVVIDSLPRADAVESLRSLRQDASNLHKALTRIRLRDEEGQPRKELCQV